MNLDRNIRTSPELAYKRGKEISRTKKKTKKTVKSTIDQVHFLFSDKLIDEILTDTARKCTEYGKPERTTLITEESLKMHLKEEFDKKIDKKNFLISREDFNKLHSVTEREELLISIGLRIFFPNYKKESRDLYLSLIILQLKRKIIAKEFIVFR